MNSEFYNHEKVAEIIESYCQSNEIDEKDFADLIGVHPTHLSRIKKGLMCSPDLLQKIAALGRMEPSNLIRQTPDSVKQILKQNGINKNIPAIV